MPGIFGFVYKAPQYETTYSKNVSLCERMIHRLCHNSAFEKEFHYESGFAVGRVDLPLAGEKRLVVDRSREAIAAFSGYIYGWKNLPRSLGSPTANKAQRILDVYRDASVDPAEAIDGSYCAAIWDARSRAAQVWVDTLGHRALYYYEHRDLLLFATEMKAFKALDDFDATVDESAVADYFNYGYPLGDKTFFARVKRLRGGHAINVVDGHVTITRVLPDLRFSEIQRNQDELIEELDSIYPEVLAQRIGGAEHVIVPLSGGLDSRFILGHALRAGVEPYTFTHGKKNCLDDRITRRIAQDCKLPHHRFIDIDPNWLPEYGERFVYLNEGMIYLRPAGLLGISKEYGLDPTRSCFLNGIFGGATNFGKGYFTQADMLDNLTHEQRLRSMRSSLFGDGRGDFYYGLFSSDRAHLIRDRYYPSIEEELSMHQAVSDRFCFQKESFFIRNRLTKGMNQIDINRHIWHDHFALYDSRLLEFYLKLPAERMVSRQFLIEYFKVKMPLLARIPYQATGRDLYSRPPGWRKRFTRWAPRVRHLVERGSYGRIQAYNMKEYYHYNQWYRTNRKIRDFFEDVLLDPQTIDRGYFDRNQLARLLNHQKNGGGSFVTLSTLISFELFHRIMVDQ